MPAAPLVFRATCGCFVGVFISFMFRRAERKVKLRYPTLKPKTRIAGAMVGLTLTAIFFSNLLLQCGDVEQNPGPPKPSSGKQTRLTSTSGTSSRMSLDAGTADRRGSSQPESGNVSGIEPSMTYLAELMTTLNTKFDGMREEFKEMKESMSELKEEVQTLRDEVADLRQTNRELERSNAELTEKVNALELKTDDMENRSKRNNIIVYGYPRERNETPDECETLLRDMITDKLELSGDFSFDRVHRLSAKQNSPIIARCTFYKEKVKILKAKGKLKGSDVFVGEDFTLRIREIRKKLIPHLKAAKAQNKRATMVYDHLLIEGKKFALGADDNALVELR